MLEPGTVVAGKLRVERLLGQGGMGTVYVATHVGLDQQVAIKVLDPALAEQPEVVQRFVREARASARLKSDHVCRVMDVGALENGVPYIEMELMVGEDLGQLIERGALATDVAADYVLQACVAIAEAHSLGIIHRDLKPANLFVTQRMDGSPLIKVLDFGIATAPTSANLQITKTTAIMGSPGYMSPEHLRSAREVDARSDIWALGVILYEAASGKLPFVAQTITELAVKVVMDEPEPLEGVDPAYAAIVARCLTKEPAQRYQNVAELVTHLAPLAGGNAEASMLLVMRISGGTASSSMPTARPPTGPVKVPTGGVKKTGTALGAVGKPLGLDTTLASGASQIMPDAPKKKRGGLIALAALVVVGGGAAAFGLTRNADEPEKKHVVQHHRDAGTQVAIVNAGAMPDAAAAKTDDTQLVMSLGEMEADHDWKGIIRLANVETTNPTINDLVAKARTAYKTEQTAALASYAKRHDCTSAKRVHDQSVSVLPEATVDFDKAAICTATSPTPQVDPATAASQALDAGDWQKALALAEQALAKDPKNSTALDVAARALCTSGDQKQADKAKSYIAQLDAQDKVVAGQVCKDHGIRFPKPTAPPKPTGPIAEADIFKENKNASTLSRNHKDAEAEALALRILATEPGNGQALKVLGVSGCRLHHQANVDRALASVYKRGPIAREIRTECDGQSQPQ
jgi:hypothetical protein